MATDHSASSHHSSHGEEPAGPLNHETTDISVDGIGKIVVGFSVGMLLVLGSMYWSYRVLDRRSLAAEVPLTPMVERSGGRDAVTPSLHDAANDMERLGRVPAGPKLLTDEPSWLQQFRVQQRDVLGTYGWVDQGTGAVRIPIARAKQLIVERGLPQAPASAGEVPAADTATPTAGDAGQPDALGQPARPTTPKANVAGSGPRPGGGSR